ncbi:hypothetical protein [Rhodovibrio sodomensis]|uniref:hypothetical protein n=1 Tax=Rhodovibrio sodomensis TaxID=1088 RepID=UPI0019081D82|nr:hypothetical protein [Rhodovibrio sodomensis]
MALVRILCALALVVGMFYFAGTYSFKGLSFIPIALFLYLIGIQIYRAVRGPQR